MQQLLEHTDRIPGMDVVFMADKDPAVQSWIRAHNNPAHLFGDMSIRLYKPTAIVNKCMKSLESLRKQSTEVLAITRRGDVDIYTCGFPCTPFSAKGMCRGWDDENSKPFFCTVDTLKSLRPRMFVLENVRGILSNHGEGMLREKFHQLGGYLVWFGKALSPSHFGVPQHRERLYILGLRQDALKHPTMTERVLKKYMKAFINEVSASDVQHWVEFVRDAGWPIEADEHGNDVDAKLAAIEIVASGICCLPSRLCTIHPCKCAGCDRGKTLGCKWRKNHRLHMLTKRFKLQRHRMLQATRTIHKDKTLMSPDSSFMIAARKGLRVNQSMTSPSKRSTLHILSQERVLMKKDVILDLSQSLGRNALRDDGLVGALACGCTQMFAPYFGKSLSIQQCMVLQGMDPSAYDLNIVSETEMFRLVGNAMCVPVVGTVIAAGMQLLRAGD